MSIAPDQASAVRQILSRCDEFQSQRALMAFFGTHELQPWQAGLPEADSLSGRVALTTDYMLRVSGVSGLARLLTALADCYDPADDRNTTLAVLGRSLRAAQPIATALTPAAARQLKDKEELLELLSRKIAFFEREQVKLTDLNQRFQLQTELEQLRAQRASVEAELARLRGDTV